MIPQKEKYLKDEKNSNIEELTNIPTNAIKSTDVSIDPKTKYS